MSGGPSRDPLGYRLKVGALIPSINACVQPEYDAMRPRGVTNHVSRMKVPNVSFADADAPSRIVETVLADVDGALERLMDCGPDVVVFAMGAPCFAGGPEGTAALRERLERAAGVPVVMPPEAVAEAARAFGGVARLGLVTPYVPAVDAKVAAWFEAAGFSAELAELGAATEAGIAGMAGGSIVDAIRGVDRPDIDAIAQLGTTMPFVHLVAGSEAWLGKPVIAVNVACYWQALRLMGIEDLVDGVGRLFATY